MTVAIPLLWGIPSRHETLRYVAVDLQTAWSCSKEPDHVLFCSTAIVSGGGYVEKVYRQWQLLG